MGGLTQDAKYWEQAEHYASQVIDEFAGDYELENMTDLIGNVFGKNRHSKETILSIDNDILDDAHIYDTRFTGELPGQELIDYPYTNVSPQSLSTDKNQEYNRISVKTVKEIYPEENDLRRKEFWYDLGHVSYTVEGEEVTSPYAFIHKWRDYHYQTNSEMLEGQGKVPVATDCDYVFWRLADVVLRVPNAARGSKDDGERRPRPDSEEGRIGSIRREYRTGSAAPGDFQRTPA